MRCAVPSHAASGRKSVMLAVLLGLAAAVNVSAQDSTSDERLKRLLERAPEADTNRDGVLTRQEAQAWLRTRRERQPDRNRNLPKPTHVNVSYGEDARQVVDLYLAESDRPTPLLVYIHGGGFVGGNKRTLSPNLLQAMHREGISVAAIHYRFIGKHQFPVPFQDAARCIQFLRHHAARYNLNAERFAATGGSAGAGISLWLATHDDMAEPEAEDPVRRQSTRLRCASVSGAQVSYDPRFWRKHGLEKGLQHSSFSLMYGVSADEPFDDPVKVAIAEECAPIRHLSQDDPPVYFRYSVPDELNDRTSLGAVVHHPRHGKLFQKEMQRLGIECHVACPGEEPPPVSSQDFLVRHLKAEERP